MAAKFPKGTLMQWGDTATATNFTTFAGVRTISLAGLVAETLDATSHDTPGSFRDKIQGLKDWGNVTFEMLGDLGGDAGHQQMFEDFKDGTERYYRIIVMAQGTPEWNMVFKGFVNDFPFTIPFDALLSVQVALTIKGDPEPEIEPGFTSP